MLMDIFYITDIYYHNFYLLIYVYRDCGEMSKMSNKNGRK